MGESQSRSSPVMDWRLVQGSSGSEPKMNGWMNSINCIFFFSDSKGDGDFFDDLNLDFCAKEVKPKHK